MGHREMIKYAKISQARGDHVQRTWLVGEWALGAWALPVRADEVPAHVASEPVSNTLGKDAPHDRAMFLPLPLSSLSVFSSMVLLNRPDNGAQATIDRSLHSSCCGLAPIKFRRINNLVASQDIHCSRTTGKY